MYDLRRLSDERINWLCYEEYEARTRACVHDSRDTQHTNDHRPRAGHHGGLCFPEHFVEFLEGQLMEPYEEGLPGSDAARDRRFSKDRELRR